MKNSDIWEKIINKCETFSTTTVTEEERIAFEVANGSSWEHLLGNYDIDMMQLDGLIVAEREKGVYICDDLFFRKIAETKKIKNINFATLLCLNDDLDEVMPIIMELSKTNYIYTPIRSRNADELNELFENLLEGKMKNYCYSNIYNAFIKTWSQALKEYFGEDWIVENENNVENIT